MEELSLSEVVERQRALEAAARKQFPYDPSECTLYMDISSRQLLFACLTCASSNAICYACAIRCHADHDLVDLYSKRGYKCDCGTLRIPQTRCALRKTDHDESPNEHYGQNFQGKFCVCHESVNDNSYGEGAMFQCLLGRRCGEDWFHARCIVGISRIEEQMRQTDEDSDESGDDMDTVYPEIPKFGALICPDCAQDVPSLQHSSIVAAEINQFLFLNEDYGAQICVSPELSPLLNEFPFLDGKETTYKPAKDEDDTTMLEAGERALQSLPRDAVINGLQKFGQLQANLVEYLRNIGSDGHAITREDVEQFFRAERDAQG